MTTERLDRLIAFLTSEISNGCNKEREGCRQVEHADRSYRYKTESQKHDGGAPEEYLAHRRLLEPKAQQSDGGQQDRY